MLRFLTISLTLGTVHLAPVPALPRVQEEHKRKVMDIVFNQIAEYYVRHLSPNMAWREFYQGTVPIMTNWTMSKEQQVTELQKKWEWLPGNQTSDFPRLVNNFEMIRNLFTEGFFEKGKEEGAIFTKEFFSVVFDNNFLDGSENDRRENIACLLDKYKAETIPRKVKNCGKDGVLVKSSTKTISLSFKILPKLANKHYVDERGLFDTNVFNTIFKEV